MIVALPMILLDLFVGAVAVYGFTRTGEPLLLVALVFVVAEIIADVRACRGDGTRTRQRATR